MTREMLDELMADADDMLRTAKTQEGIAAATFAKRLIEVMRDGFIKTPKRASHHA